MTFGGQLIGYPLGADTRDTNMNKAGNYGDQCG